MQVRSAGARDIDSPELSVFGVVFMQGGREIFMSGGVFRTRR